MSAARRCPASLRRRGRAPRRRRGWCNVYGPTETTVDVTLPLLDADDADGRAAVPIGRADRRNARLYVLDRRLQPVPLGRAGELYVGGAGWRAATWAGRS